MRVIEHDPDRRHRAERQAISFEPFRTVKLGRGRELRIDLAKGPDTMSVSARLFRVRDEGDHLASDAMHLFPAQLAETIAALTEAAAAIGALPGPAEPDPAAG